MMYIYIQYNISGYPAHPRSQTSSSSLNRSSTQMGFPQVPTSFEKLFRCPVQRLATSWEIWEGPESTAKRRTAELTAVQ